MLYRKVTVSDAVLRCLKKGKGEEQALSAKCLSLLCISLGQDADELITDMHLALVTVLKDKSASLNARAEVCFHPSVKNHMFWQVCVRGSFAKSWKKETRLIMIIFSILVQFLPAFSKILPTTSVTLNLLSENAFIFEESANWLSGIEYNNLLPLKHDF